MRNDSLYILVVLSFLGAGLAFADSFPMPDLTDLNTQKNEPMQIEMQADQVSFSSAENKAQAKGKVVVTAKDKFLYCDELELDRVVQQAVARGHVYLDTPKENIIADDLTYNFKSGTGEFHNARVFVDPYQVRAKKINKVSDNHMSMDEGYMTTCDLDEPHFRMGAKRMDIYQHDRAEVRGMKIYLGKMPMMYLPRYTQDLKNRPIVTFIPGVKKDFGAFLLGTARLQLNPNLKVNLRFDVRERLGFGEGVDIKYNTPSFGSGLISTYYTAEREIASRHIWNLYDSNGVKKGPTKRHERYRIIWRHRWQINDRTDAVVQYYKIHDYDIVNNGFLKRYFPREYRQDSQNMSLNSYFLLTHVMPHGTMTFNVDTSRVNRPIRGVERIPEIRYIHNNREIGDTGFYLKSTNTFSNLSHQNYPKTFNRKTLRFDTDNDVSRPFKLGFIQFTPHVGGQQTYYSRTANLTQRNVLRGLFRSSLDMTTKFYKVWDYRSNFAGMDIKGLRHVVTPMVTYFYQARPTIPSSNLNQFDPTIDNLFKINEFRLGLENKLQTKRNGQVVDLIRALLTSTFGLKGTTGDLGVQPYRLQLDFNPNDWLSFHGDAQYDFHHDHADFVNFDGTVHHGSWSFGLGNRFTRRQGNQLTTEWGYRLNPKWKLRVFNTFPVTKATHGNTTSAREYEIMVTRDLHEWEMDMAINQLQGQGTTFFVLFRLKAFPDMELDFINTMFHSSRPGAQNP